MKNLVAGVVLGAAMFTAGAVFTASKSDDDVLREARDRQQIDELMWRYARALDTGDADGYAALYTTDGQFSSGANATKGRDALKKTAADVSHHREPPDCFHRQGSRTHRRIPHHDGCRSRTGDAAARRRRWPQHRRARARERSVADQVTQRRADGLTTTPRPNVIRR